jgi:hypothetical protein
MALVVTVRVHMKVADLEAAMSEALRLLALARPVGEVLACGTSAYDRAQSMYEATLRLKPADAPAAYAQLKTALAPGWKEGGSPDDRWALWEGPDMGAFTLATTVWAEVAMSEERILPTL